MQRIDGRGRVEGLLEHAEWVRALALSLVQDPEHADDLVQDTWVAALVRPPRIAPDDGHGAGRADALERAAKQERAWLAQVLRNLAARLRRTQMRRETRERRAARAEHVSEDALTAGHLELHQRLVEAVEELDPGSRTIVLMRYLEGLPPREIAQRLELSGTVVRKRLSRALEKLRQRFDREHDGDRRAWALPFAAWALPERSAASLPSAAALVLAAAAAVVALVWGLTWTRAERGAGPEVAARDVPAPAAVEVAPAERVEAARTAPEPVAAPEVVAPPPERERWIEGRVVAPPGSPADDTLAVRLVRPAASDTGLPPWISHKEDSEAAREWLEQAAFVELDCAPVDADGAFRIRPPEEGLDAALLVDGRFLYMESAAPLGETAEGERIELHPRLGGTLRGRLVRPSGELEEGELGDERDRVLAIRHEPYFSYESRAGRRERMRLVRPAADGRFELRGVPAGVALVVGARTERFRPESVRLDPLAPGEERAVEVPLVAGVVVRGRTLDDAGRPVPGATVVVSSTASRSRFRETPELADKIGRSDEHGRFAIAGVELGSAFAHARRPGWMWSDWAQLRPAEVEDGELNLDLVLERGETLGGRVVWPDGEPAAGATVEVSILQPLDNRWIQGRGAEVTTDADGRFRVTGLTRGRLAVRANATRATGDDDAPTEHGWVDRYAILPDEALELELLHPLSVEGVVRTSDGEPLDAFEVLLQRGDHNRLLGLPLKAPSVHRFDGTDGRFRLPDLAAGGWQLRARAPGFETTGLVQLVLTGAPDPLPAELVLRRACTVIGFVVDPYGDPVPGASVALGDDVALARMQAGLDTPRFHTARTDAEGLFRIDGVGPGEVVVQANAEGWATSETLRATAVAGTDPLELVLEVRPAGRVHGRLTDESGEPIRYWMVWLGKSEGLSDRTAKSDADGRFAFEEVPPGNWLLYAMPNPSDMLAAGLDPNRQGDRMRVMLRGTVCLTPGGDIEADMQRVR